MRICTKQVKHLLLYCVTIILLIMYYWRVLNQTNNKSRVDRHVDRVHTSIKLKKESHSISKPRIIAETKKNRKELKKLKYILQWTSDSNVPFVDMGQGQNGFIKRKCPFKNCFVTSNKSLLGDYTKFDVVAFAGPELSNELYYNIDLPTKRSPHQKYVFASIESAANYPICKPQYDNYFNWTWTYKIDSEVQWGYIAIRDIFREVIGPGKEPNWIKEMMPVSDDFRESLRTKKVAGAWFVSNCYTASEREIFVKKLQKELNRYSDKNDTGAYTIDIYGTCGQLQCSKDEDEICNTMIKENYYFYLAFENAISPDYVTEKMLKALYNNAVPIVYGGANYSRFLPPGSYLNARELGVETLAEKMYELMNNPGKYEEYFKWKNYYTFHPTTEAVDTNEYCRFCELLNNDKMLKSHSSYSDFRKWWNIPGFCGVQIWS